MYKKASILKLRFSSNKGNLTVEDLWDLSLSALDKIAVALDEEVSKAPKKSFIQEVSPENAVLELKFNIVKDIIDTKLAEKKERESLKTKQEEKAKLLEILHRKQNESLEQLSVEELQKRIADLS